MERGDRVRIHEDGISPWTGTVRAVKPTLKHGTRLEVERDDSDHMHYAVVDGPQVERIGLGS